MAESGGEKRRNGIPEWLMALRKVSDEDPVILDGPQEAMDGMVDNDEPLRISLLDPDGVEIAAVTGVAGGPLSVEPQGETPVAEFALTRDGMTVAARIPLDPESECAIFPDGVLRGRLPSGISWCIAPLEPAP